MTVNINRLIQDQAAVTVQKNSVNVGDGQILNFIEGSNVTLTVADAGSTINVTIAAAGGGITDLRSSGFAATVGASTSFQSWSVPGVNFLTEFSVGFGFMNNGIGMGIGGENGRTSITSDWNGANKPDSPRVGFGYFYYDSLTSTYLEWHTGSQDVWSKRAGGTGFGTTMMYIMGR